MHYYQLQAELTQSLLPGYDEREAAHLARLVLMQAGGLTKTQLVIANRDEVPTEVLAQARNLQSRLIAGEPWQYITGQAEFCGHTFAVGPGVLIPRPETEMLVELALDAYPADQEIRVLDACTGSGCISHSIALARPNWQVAGFDISEDALSYARLNGAHLKSGVAIFLADALGPSEALAELGSLDSLVSNPPYIPVSEQSSLANHVAGQEPDQALFVPNENPMLFYKALERHGRSLLKQGGAILLEVHAPLAAETLVLFQNTAWLKPKLHQDLHNRPRVVQAWLA